MIAVCPNPYRDLGFATTDRVCALLDEAGYESVVCPVFSHDEPDIVPSRLKAKKLRDVAALCSLAIVIGGDGTILAVTREIYDLNLPLLGINLGTKGFMTALEPDELPSLLQAAAGDYRLSRRMMLDVSLSRGGARVYADCALNDAVIHGYGDCVRLTAWCDGQRMTSYSGDGIILATPTGSTGYSMSAGGPIVEPEACNILFSPICAHALGSRSFVLDPERVVTVQTEVAHGRKAYLSVDGHSMFDLAGGDLLTVRRSAHSILMVQLGQKSFYETTFDKLT